MKVEIFQMHPKHVLQKNGLFQWQIINNEMYRCGHSKKIHLDSYGICLDKSRVDLKGICICEAFASPNQTISTLTDIPKKKLPRETEMENSDILVKDGKIAQDDHNRFFQQYGIFD